MVCCQHQVLQLTQLTNLLPGTFSYICTKIKQSLFEQIQQQQYLAISSISNFSKIQKCNFHKFTVIDLQMNTTKVVVMTFPNSNKRILWSIEKNSNFSQPISPSKSIFSPFEPSLEVITHHMECTQVKCTHPSNTPTCTLQLSCNITKEMYLSSCTQTMFSFYDTSKWSQFSFDHALWKSQSCRYATLEFHKLGIYLEQIACFITNHAIIILK